MPINTFVGMGRLAFQPELKTTGSGVEVASFTIAIDRIVSKDKEKACDFINCVAWRQTAIFLCKWFNKGDMVAVTGSMRSRRYVDKEDKPHNIHEILVNNVSFCGSTRNDSGEQAEAQTEPAANTAPSYNSPPAVHFEDLAENDELPF